ncbi:hypothetical protein CR513_01057, partial [Mucuna pruriens]
MKGQGYKKLSHIKENDPPRDDPKFEVWDEYYETLNGLWIELDQYQGLKMCKVDSIAYTRLVERGRIFKFLHGLNSKYNPIQVQILGKEKLPSLSKTYSTKKDSIACYDIESKIFNFRQGTFLVIEYYETLNGLWIELDQYQGLKMCKIDSIAYTRLVEKGRIFKFLHGLNSKYNPIRVQILGKEKLPSLSKLGHWSRDGMLWQLNAPPHTCREIHNNFGVIGFGGCNFYLS